MPFYYLSVLCRGELRCVLTGQSKVRGDWPNGSQFNWFDGWITRGRVVKWFPTRSGIWPVSFSFFFSFSFEARRCNEATGINWLRGWMRNTPIMGRHNCWLDFQRGAPICLVFDIIRETLAVELNTLDWMLYIWKKKHFPPFFIQYYWKNSFLFSLLWSSWLYSWTFYWNFVFLGI